MDKGEDSQDAESEENDANTHNVDEIADPWQFGCHQLVCSLH